MVAFGTIHDWCPEPGTVVSWHATPAARAVAAAAPVDPAPPSYQQSQHLRNFRQHLAAGRDMARLAFGSWDVQGTCDTDLMTQAINAHLRRHDAYHSWFEFTGGADGAERIQRHTIADPEQITYEPIDRGTLSTEQLRDHLLGTTPDPLQWDCFTFGIIQRADHFTVYMSVDHLVTDGMSAGVVFLELHMMYAALQHGAVLPLPETGSYREYCIRERAKTDAMTLESPEVQAWIEFAALNGGTLPGFPLPIGDLDTPSLGGMIVVPLMDAEQADVFDAACERAGVRFSGGVFACAALAEQRLTGTDLYTGLTPYDTRSTPEEFMTPGWFASFIPVTARIEGDFGQVAKALQESFDAGKALGNVPFHRVLELTADQPDLMHAPERDVPLLSYLDARKVPFTDTWDSLNAGIYGDSRLSDQVCVWVNRFATETTLAVSYPDNAQARESVQRYVNAVTAVYSEIVDRTSAEIR
jgi:mycolipenoyl-CoA---2-(long-chain-fatty acyl)-trehalose mycolipenoyltransferase / long-chain-acyl-CoA---trehalose acyltransferase